MGVAGTDLSGWSIVLYNDNGGAPYNVQTLSGTMPATCDAHGVTVVDYPTNGIQNGSPDGMALVDPAGAVVSFLSYEGTFAAVDGPAEGPTWVDIGALQGSSTPIGASLQRGDAGNFVAQPTHTAGACNGGPPEDDDPPPPPSPSSNPFISELHYDNDGADTDEAVEVTGPAGTDLTGWSIAFYNGNGGGSYGSAPLSGVIPATRDSLGVVTVAFAGIQNGAPDGLALVRPDNSVVEFLSYEGPMTAADGPAAGLASTDIGVSEASSTPVDQSLQKIGGAWQGPLASSFGACNGGTTPPPSGATTILIHELMGDPVSADSDSRDEWFEVFNYGIDSVNLQGWTIASGGSGQTDHVIGAPVVVPAGGYSVLGRDDDTSLNGGVLVNYEHYVGSHTIWLDSSDWLALRDPSGVSVDSITWTALPEGATKGMWNPAAESLDVDGDNWGYSTTTYGAGDYGTPGTANGPLSDTAPNPPTVPGGGGSLSMSGRSANAPPLPVGFQDQLFANSGSGTIIWSSTTPSVATVDADGVVTALATGTTTIRAEDANGAFSTLCSPPPSAQRAARRFTRTTRSSVAR